MRFFSKEQSDEHAQEIGGYHSELIDPDTRQPYPGRIERHHIDSYGSGGETEVENLMFLDIVSHAIIHLISDEPWAFKLIVRRMNEEQLQELHRRGY